MNIELIRKWVAALRSGKYAQCRGVLESKVLFDTADSSSYCCLGVLQQVEPGIGSDGGLLYRPDLNRHIGCSLNQDELAKLNDDDGKTFSEIADFIESKYISKEEDKSCAV